jgi:hypothetical protein
MEKEKQVLNYIQGFSTIAKAVPDSPATCPIAIPAIPVADASEKR